MAGIRYGVIPGTEKDRGGYLEVDTNIDTDIAISFPPVLEDDKKANVEAIVAAATLSGHPDAGVLPQELTAKMLLEALDVEDIEQALGELPDPEREDLAKAVEQLREALSGNS
jgi:DNA-directed RNA polymerase specialized sigma24 family protein